MLALEKDLRRRPCGTAIAKGQLAYAAVLFVFCATSLLADLSTAQEQKHPLTLPEAVSAAVRVSPDIRAAQLRILSADLGARAADLAPYPVLRYKLGLGYSPTGRSFGYDPALTNEGQLNAQLSLDGNIYNGGALGLARSQARIDQQHAALSREQTQADIELAVRRAYNDALHAQNTLMIEQESIHELEQYREAIELLFHGAGAAATDIARTDIRVSAERIALTKAQSDEQLARVELAALIGSPSDTSFVLVDPADTSTLIAIAPADTIETLGRAMAQSDVHRAALDVELAKAESRPSVDATLDAGLLTSFQNLRLASQDRNPMIGASIGINVTGPILDWGQNRTEIEQRTASLESLRNEVTRQDRETTRQLAELQIALRATHDRIGHQKELTQHAADVYDLVRARYASGGSSSAEVLDAHRDLADARTGLLDLHHDLAELHAELVHLLAAPTHDRDRETIIK